MIDRNFSDIQIYLLLISSFSFLISMYFFVKGNEKFFLIFLLLAAFSVNCFSSLLDPFLNIWDERFHALVAKNMINHPFIPTLYDEPIVNMDYDRWDRYYVWLHKQPFFLWQIALSFKLFGISEFALRIPSIILGTVMVFVGYRTGRLLINRRVGYLTAVLIMTSFYFRELIAGRLVADHNDVSFLVYVSLSVWSFIEYYYTKNKIWILFIGLFSGIAILCKWLTGLLVYFGWGILKLISRDYRIKDILISLILTVLVALPWQILIFVWYPTEAKLANDYNTLHFFVPVEGHESSMFFYFSKFNNLYGEYTVWLAIPAFMIFYKKVRNKKVYFSLLSMVIITYLFFSVAATKMISYPVIVSLIVFVAFASMIDYILFYIEAFNINKFYITSITILFIIGLVIYRFDIEAVKEKHSLIKEENSYSQMLLHNKKVFISLNLPKNTIICNVKGRHYIESMFYTGLISYSFIPNEKQYLDLKKKNFKIAVFQPEDNMLPEYLQNDSTIIIRKRLQGYE